MSPKKANFESMMFRLSQGGICDRSLRGYDMGEGSRMPRNLQEICQCFAFHDGILKIGMMKVILFMGGKSCAPAWMFFNPCN